MLLNKFFRYFERLLKIRKLIKEEVNISEEYIEKKVVLNSLRWLADSFIMEVNLAIILIKSGYCVDIIVDDGRFEHNDTILFDQEKSIKYYKLIFFKNKLRRKLEFFIWNLLIGRISNRFNFIKVSNINRTISYDGKDYDSYVKESLIRFFQTDILTNSELYKWYKEITIKNAIISQKIGIYSNGELSKNKKSIFLTSHGIYSLWGPAFKKINFNNRKIVYGPNFYQRKSISFFNHIHQVTNSENSLIKFLTKDFEKTKKDRVREYVENRFLFKEKDTKIYFADQSKNKYKIKDRSKFPGKVFVAYPNIVWDGNVYERNNLFETISDWLIQILDHFKKNNNNSLIIRFHPAETTWFKGTKTFESILKDHLIGIEEFNNIAVISSSDTFNSYNLFKNYSDFTLVYDGIIALESTFLNVPVVFAANGRFNVDDYGIQFDSQEEYMEFLSNPKEYDRINNDVIIAEKLIYYYMFLNSRYFPVLDNDYSDFGIDTDVFIKDKSILKESCKSVIEGINQCL